VVSEAIEKTGERKFSDGEGVDKKAGNAKQGIGSRELGV
jgi:hypothetical protein